MRQSRIDNPEKLATLSTPDTGGTQTETTNNTICV
jgi:hypothetical protein